MSNLIPIEFKNQRIMTTKVLAEQYGTEEKNIQMNFINNQVRFIEGKHYLKLDGKGLKDFKNSLPNEIREPLKFAPVLYLWTEKGAARHAKILDTDEAWEVYEALEETYFRVKDNPYQGLSKELQAVFILDKKTQEIEERVDDLEANMPLFNIDCKELQALVRKVGIKALGGYKSPAYNDNSLRGKVYADIQQQLKREFGVTRYEAIKRSQLETATRIIEGYKVPMVLLDEIMLVNNQMAYEEVACTK